MEGPPQVKIGVDREPIKRGIPGRAGPETRCGLNWGGITVAAGEGNQLRWVRTELRQRQCREKPRPMVGIFLRAG